MAEHPRAGIDGLAVVGMGAGYKRKAYHYFLFVVLSCLFATALYFGTAKEIYEKKYTALEREAFIIDALLNVKHSPVKKNVFPTYDVSTPVDLSPREKAVFKFSKAVSVGFGWSRKYNSSTPRVYQRGLASYETFYAPLEWELKAFLPQLKEAMGFDVSFVNVSEEIAAEEKGDVRIRIISDYHSTRWVDGKPVFNGYDNVLILHDPRMRSDVISFDIMSPFLMGYAYFDEEHNITHVVCQMWMYMKPAERRETMRECIVRGLGVVGKIDGREHFQTPGLPDILKKTLGFLYCDEVKSGMEKEALLKVLREGRCLPKHKK